MLRRDFPELLPRLAAGLVGEGSECFGFDDEISRDHDFGPGFCIWLSDADFERFGKDLQRAYDALPGEFMGFPKRIPEPHAGKRVGVFSVSGFYRQFIGAEQPPASIPRWMILKEEYLATATNGKVFADGTGEFTSIREALLAGYPEALRIRRISETLRQIAQAGQYNYGRCMCRGEIVGAELAKDTFVRAVLQLCFLLNRRYMPYYKWAFRSAESLPILNAALPLIRKLYQLPIQTYAWQEPADPYRNLRDRKVEVIEEICGMILAELKRQGLTEGDEDFLEPHACRIAAHTIL